MNCEDHMTDQVAAAAIKTYEQTLGRIADFELNLVDCRRRHELALAAALGAAIEASKCLDWPALVLELIPTHTPKAQQEAEGPAP